MARQYGYHLETRLDDCSGVIEQVLFSTMDDARTEVMRTVLKTQEEHIRQALIKLGWTPPPE